MSRRTDRRQSRAEAQLRYRPEADALRSILRGLTSSKKQDVTQARRAAYMLQASAKSGIPTLKHVYNQAARNSKAQFAMSTAELAKLGPAGDAYKAALAFDKSLPTGQSKAAAIHELVSRAAAAPEERMSEVRAIRSGYAADRQKVIDQLTSNARSAGLYASTRFGELRGEAAKTRNENRQKAKDRRVGLKKERISTRQSERNSKRSAGIDPDTGKPIPGGKLDPTAKKKSKLTQNQVSAALDNISSARQQYESAVGTKGWDPSTTPATIRKTLLVGTAYMKDGTSQKVPHITSNLQITAGFELAQTGHLTRGTYRQLRARGVNVPKGWRPGNVGSKPSTGAAGYPAGRGAGQVH